MVVKLWKADGCFNHFQMPPNLQHEASDVCNVWDYEEKGKLILKMPGGLEERKAGEGLQPEQGGSCEGLKSGSWCSRSSLSLGQMDEIRASAAFSLCE